MADFVAHYGIWLLAAFVVGTLTALLSRRTGPLASAEEVATHLRSADFVFAICFFIFIAFVQTTSGRLALYCENALALFAAFLAGMLVSAYLDGSLPRDGKSWGIGLASVATIWLVANISVTGGVETDLRHRARTVVERAGGNPLNLDVRGRDIFLPANVASRPRLAREIVRATPARHVMEIDRLSGPAARLLDRAIAEAAKRRQKMSELKKTLSKTPRASPWERPAEVDDPESPQMRPTGGASRPTAANDNGSRPQNHRAELTLQ